MPKFRVAFERSVREVVEVEAPTIDDAVDLVYDSFGQDMEVCKSIDIQEQEFEVVWKETAD